MKELKLSDPVLHRIVQIIQEALLLGVDCSDIMRQIRLTTSSDDDSVLVLSDEYQKSVVAMHQKLLEEVMQKQPEKPPLLRLSCLKSKPLLRLRSYAISD